jgi:hypothetical protein
MRPANAPGDYVRNYCELDSVHARDGRSLPMKALWVASLGLVALLTTAGCKQKNPEPIPGPKAPGTGMASTRAAGIAWFQGSLDEAFARTQAHATCSMERAPMVPLTPDISRPVRPRVSAPAPVTTARRPLVQVSPTPLLRARFAGDFATRSPAWSEAQTRTLSPDLT